MKTRGKTVTNTEEGEFILSGDLTVERSAELKMVLIKALEKSGKLVLDLKMVTDVDVSCLQLFCAANKSVQNINATLTVKDSKVAEKFKRALHESGYANEKCLSKDFCKKCLWKEVTQDG